MGDNINLRISEDVIAVIAAKVILSISGVHELSGGIISGINNMLGKKLPTQGIKVDMSDGNILLEVYIEVDYGVKIPDIAWEIQDKVKKELESMTGLKVTTINVHIQGINFEKGNNK
jgi:uncharacterized alkaline shock family protein YloU